MQKPWMPLLALSLIVLACPAANAQDKGQTGLTIAFPASVGFVWHVSDRVALRPDVSFSFSNSSTDAPPLSSSVDGSSFGVGLSGLFYVGKWEKLRAYITPRFSYARINTEVSTAVVPPFPAGVTYVLNSPSANTTSIYGVSGSFGAQYSLSSKFGVFGEAGLGYSDQRSTTSFSASSGWTHTFGTRAGVGLIFYF